MDQKDSLTKSIFILLQLKHHLEENQKSSRQRFLRAQLDEVPTLIRPAVPNPDITRELYSITDKYIAALEIALDNHYTERLVNAERALSQRKHDPSAVQAAFQAAVQRAKGKYGRKLNPDIVSSTSAFLACTLTNNRPVVNTEITPLTTNHPVFNTEITPFTETPTNMAVKGRNHPLSNFWVFPHPVKYREVSFSSGEHFYQFSKAMFFDYPDFAHHLLTIHSPSRVKQETKKFFENLPQTPDFLKKAHHWDNVSRPRISNRIFELKFDHFEAFRRELKKPGYFYHPVRDTWWGTGSEELHIPRGPGRDHFGRLLMAFRFEMFGIPAPLIPLKPTVQPVRPPLPTTQVTRTGPTPRPPSAIPQDTRIEPDVESTTPPTAPPALIPLLPQHTEAPRKGACTTTKRRVSTPTAPSPPPTKRHCLTSPKSSWRTPVCKEAIMIVGDSNIARLPPNTPSNWSTHCYPGAKIEDIDQILSKIYTDLTPRDVIIYAGINNHADRLSPARAEKLITHLLDTAQEAFPNAKIHLPKIAHGFISNTPESNTMFHLETARNQLIPRQKIRMPHTTMTDKVHWTTTTAANILQSWKDFLGVSNPLPQRKKTAK